MTSDTKRNERGDMDFTPWLIYFRENPPLQDAIEG